MWFVNYIPELLWQVWKSLPQLLSVDHAILGMYSMSHSCGAAIMESVKISLGDYWVDFQNWGKHTLSEVWIWKQSFWLEYKWEIFKNRTLLLELDQDH